MIALMLQDSRSFFIGVLVSAVCFCVAGFLYTCFVRPALVEKGALDFEARWSKWLKNRWDLVGAAGIGIFAGVWNFALDAVVVLFHVAENIFPVLTTIDLTPFTLPDWVRTSIQLGSALLPAIRAAIIAVKADKGGGP